MLRIKFQLLRSVFIKERDCLVEKDIGGKIILKHVFEEVEWKCVYRIHLAQGRQKCH